MSKALVATTADACPPSPLPFEPLAALEAAAVAFGHDVPVGRESISAWREDAARWFAAALTNGSRERVVTILNRCLRRLGEVGAGDIGVAPAMLAKADEYVSRGWAGVAAAMLCAPAWQWTRRPAITGVPVWLAPAVAEYLFQPPHVLTVFGQAEAYACCHLAAVREVAALVEANRGSQVAVASLESFRRAEGASCLRLAAGVLPDLDAAHGRLLAALSRAPAMPEPALVPRIGRKLKLAVVAGALAPSRSALRVAALLERLDSMRFEVVLFVAHSDDSPVVRQLTNRGATLAILPEGRVAAAEMLRDANLDVALYVVDSSRPSIDPIAALVPLRLAGVQVVFDAGSGALPLKECDLLLRGAAEPVCRDDSKLARVAHLPGLGPLTRCELTAADPDRAWTRAEAGLADGAFVCAVLADLDLVLPEVKEAWVRVLAAIPTAELLLAPAVPPERDTVPDLDRFCADFEERLAAAGIDSGRVRVVPSRRCAYEDLRLPLALADVLLDAPPAGEVEPCVAAIELGIPVITYQSRATGDTRVAELLRLAGLAHQVAPSIGAYVDDVARFAAMAAAERDVVRNRIVAAAPAVLMRHDSLAQGETFAGLVEAAFDQIGESRSRFARLRSPLRMVAEAPAALGEEAKFFIELGSGADAELRARALLRHDPADPAARQLLAEALSVSGRHDEAMAVAVAIVELRARDASAWHQIAVVAQRARRFADAAQAVESALRLDDSRTDSWWLLLALAKHAGNSEIQQEVIAVLKQHAPDDPRLAEYAAAGAA